MNEPPGREVAIFTRALELPEDRRSAYLAEACGGDDGLRSQVEGLLRAHVSAADFMETAPGDSARHGVSGIGEKVGDRIGRYHLLQQIGEGGCGVVFMAEQETPVRRMVALKVVKPGMDSKSVVARFEAERQALALMDHPNIATVLDGGSTETGRPYFVMELVRGLKITDYCDRNSLSTPERLELFLQVCHAVQHAHQKGIIHRDLKPSNILVTVDESGKPLPKVIDFGIAKAVSSLRLTDRTVFTAFEMLIGTPAYMSPEQAALTSVDVDTRSDIYSLGVLLYELLTGTTPFDTQELLKAGLDEVRRVILHQEPVRPSTRLCTMLAADLTTVAQHRQIEAPRLIRSVRGDLDWIVIKALEKDRTRRYHTANGLAEDVRRYLANEVILARSPGVGYRFRKLVERNRVVFTAATAILAMLVVALVSVTRSLEQEREARLEADAERRSAVTKAAESEAVTGFFGSMLEGVGPGVALGRDTVLLREILDTAAQRIGSELTNQPAAEARLRQVMGRVYFELSLSDQAEAMHRAALERLRLISTNERPELVRALTELARVKDQQRDFVVGESLSRQAHEMSRRLDPPLPLSEAEALHAWSRSLLGLGRLDEAELRLRQALEIRRDLLGSNHAVTVATLHDLARVIGRQGRPGEAEGLFREALDQFRRVHGPEHPQVAVAIVELGRILRDQQRMEEAEDCFREALALQRRFLGQGHLDEVAGMIYLGLTQRDRDRLADAETTFREALWILRRFTGSDPQRLVVVLGFLANVLARQEKWTEVEPVYRELLAKRSQLLGEQHLETLGTAKSFIAVLVHNGKTTEADQLVSETLAKAKDQTNLVISLLETRMDRLARQGRWEEARTDAERVLPHRVDRHEVYHTLAPLLAQLRDSAAYRQLCGTILEHFGNTTNLLVADRMAKDCLILPMPGLDLEAVTQLADLPVRVPDHPAAAFFSLCKALAEYRQGRLAEAVPWAENAMAGSSVHAKVEAGAVLAMARHRLGDGNGARAALSNALSVAETQLPRADSGDLGSDWRDWIIAHQLLKEARTLVEGGAAAGR